MDTDDSRNRRAPEAVELPQADADAPVPDPEPTGNPGVDAALERLRELADRPTAAHPEVYDDVHRRLQTVLAEIGQPGQPGAAR